VERLSSRFGKAGAEDLRLALRLGQGAVEQLLLAPRSGQPGAERFPAYFVGRFRCFCTEARSLAKYLGYFLGAFLLLRGLDRWLFAPLAAAARRAGDARMLPRIQSGAFALLIAS